MLRKLKQTIKILLFILLLPTYYLAADNLTQEDINRSIDLYIECHSGTPPVLEFLLKDPQKVVKKIDLDFDGDGLPDLELQEKYPKNEIIFRGDPYRKPGIYHLMAYIHTDKSIFIRKYKLAFTGFIWGKNNFNFANDGEFEDKIDFVSKTIFDWGEERFGKLNNEERMTILYIMYSLYRGSIGRCYGFSGGELLYLEDPALIPWPYNCAFEIPEEDPRIIRAMDFVQNDIVFNNFVNHKISLDKKQNNKAIIKQLKLIEKTIIDGKPITLGYVSRKMHHSMVVYGYWKNIYRNRTTLITANNWEREQKDNIYSKDAENIVITMNKNSHRIVWHDITGERYRYPDIIFGIEPRKKYLPKDEEFLSLMKKYDRYIKDNRVNILMIEKTETAYVVDKNGKKVGFDKPNFFFEIPSIKFKKIDYNYLFEIPDDKKVTIVLKRRRYNSFKSIYKKVNMFIISPTNPVSTGEYYDIKIDDKNESHFRISKGKLLKVE